MTNPHGSTPPKALFPHEDLPVFQHSLAFASAAERLAALIARRPDLADQLRRASTSVLLNLAEGAGEYRGREKARFYRMSKRSAYECAALVSLASELGLLAAAPAEEARGSLHEITGMLTGLIRTFEHRPR